MAYRHGVYISEKPTSLISPVTSDSAIPVFVGTAPLHLSETGLENLDKKVNSPILAYLYEEAVSKLGFVRDSKRWKDYTLSECVYSQFALYAVAPAIFINVLDPDVHKKSIAGAAYEVSDKQARLGDDVILDSVVVSVTDGGDALVAGTDYSLGWNKDGAAMLNVLDGGILDGAASAWASFDVIDPAAVTPADIIGGYNVATKKYEGLELINSIFNKFRLVIGEVVVPRFSEDPSVAAIMYAKADAVSGVFKAMAHVDIPCGANGVKDYTEVPEWKNDKNYVYEKEIAFWPQVRLGEDQFHLSVQCAGLAGKVDSANSGVPVEAFSNKNLQMDSLVLEDGTEVDLDLFTQANYLNGEGITTAVNFIGGWRAWGVQTAAYPANSDVKDSMIPVRRMFNWIGNSLILTYFQKVDKPLLKRNIETVIDSANVWLNGLAAREFLIGHPHVEFSSDDNPTTDLMAGIVRFHVYATPPSAMKEIEFILEYDVAQLATLFETE
ncbi:MAG: phage tail sheath family protein [Synergistaceae bacterium]|jgi:phage tail sheath protein FI|nr:phage tail sheath family protein [Synergistaceae bacterium]